ncbi:hypothetical protein [Streptosporangium sp. LJ11]|uniref:hypothetical protein n=1 Tax=Streptosporangium sp. LJ11 TaxID=3436927 RepID=UPI003F7A36C7
MKLRKRPGDHLALGALGNDLRKIGGIGGGHGKDLRVGSGEPGTAETVTEPFAEPRFDRCQTGFVDQPGPGLLLGDMQIALKSLDHARWWQYHGCGVFRQGLGGTWNGCQGKGGDRQDTSHYGGMSAGHRSLLDLGFR